MVISSKIANTCDANCWQVVLPLAAVQVSVPGVARIWRMGSNRRQPAVCTGMELGVSSTCSVDRRMERPEGKDNGKAIVTLPVTVTRIT